MPPANKRLSSTCLHCKKLVIYDKLTPWPVGHSRNKEGKTPKWRGYAWKHHRRPIGDEIACDPSHTHPVWFDKTARPTTYCIEHTRGSDVYAARSMCNRPVKELYEGIPMCGIHAGRYRREKRKEEEYRQHAEVSNYVMTETTALGMQLKEGFGLDSKIHYNFHTHEYTGLIMVNPAELLELLNSCFDD